MFVGVISLARAAPEAGTVVSSLGTRPLVCPTVSILGARNALKQTNSYSYEVFFVVHQRARAAGQMVVSISS